MNGQKNYHWIRTKESRREPEKLGGAAKVDPDITFKDLSIEWLIILRHNVSLLL